MIIRVFTRLMNDFYLRFHLQNLKPSLPITVFFRVHRGYIVNLEQVEDIEAVSAGILQLGIKDVPDKKIPVSRRRVVSLKRALGL